MLSLGCKYTECGLDPSSSRQHWLAPKSTPLLFLFAVLFMRLLGHAVVAAPLAEETFSRGWLQNAIADDLPPSRRRWAFAIAALAFALSHVGTYGVPRLVLGLVAGALFAAFGGLGPGMLAHAVHNGVVVLYGGT